jgi:signal peptidase I
LIVIVVAGEGIKSIIRSKLVQAYNIPSDAMAPALVSGDHIMTDKTAYRSRSPERFDVVVFEYPEDPQKTFVKRVLGLPGETIEVRNKKVWINGSPLQEPYVHSAARTDGLEKSPGDSFGPVHIPERNYFLLGDNRALSYDSRFWGPVVRDKIWGRVCVIYFSWASDVFSVRWDRIGAAVK